MITVRDTLHLTGLSGVTIEDVLIDTGGDGIVIDNCRDVTIARVIVNACDGDGIRVRGSANVSIEDCAIYGYDTGSAVDGTFTCAHPGPRGGIRVLADSRDVTLTSTVIEHSQGLVLDAVDDVVVRGLHMADVCGAPLTLRGRGRRLDIGDIDVCNVLSDVPRAVQPAHVPAERPHQCA
ncbi:right-handed parallel beta-helix repeat-containing protein [Kibdelosporangium phytohabitans]|uniref:Right handed beta helix domain-containing protein n=1 Tax=Kibdelosporangium phytohabitans TaxID=860235 RepID=A0A0N9I5B0_9PSEU|nr:right-handed parallel beta-helix repeat-containing protein [Kibdelosporangium phytohabitans]ALG11286.1 hypothetical protein AOZ06_34340 [Kibdelosporangium phytohabitans]MBE1462577.1 hypothetical protein [Kibdelosporangium phytohabitans]